MNRDQKAAVVEDVASEIDAAQAIFAIDYRGISVKQSAELRGRLQEAGARFRVVKNRLTQRAADKAGAEALKEMLEGPTALTFVSDDAALAAKALAAFRREHGVLAFKGGTMDGAPLTAEEIEAISRLPARDVLYGQLVGITASPLTGLARGLSGLLSGLASQLGQIRDQGLVGDGAAAEAQPAAEADGEPAANAGGPDSEADEEGAAAAPEPATDTDAPEPPAEAPGDPVSEAAAAEEETAGGDEAVAETDNAESVGGDDAETEDQD